MLTRWNDSLADWDRPFAALSDLRREMDRLFWEFERGGSGGAQAGVRGGWPRVTLHDDGNQLMLRAEVPGLSEDDLNITIEQGSLTLRGERKPDSPEGYSVHRQERPVVAFARSFTLPIPVDPEKATAKLKHGVLELTLPKAAEAQPRQIQIRAS